MGKGLGAGLVSGGFVGAVVLSMLSLYAPLPQDKIDAAPKLQSQSPEPQAVAPSDDTTSVAPETLTATQAAQTQSAAATEVADTDTTIAPVTTPAEADVVEAAPAQPATATETAATAISQAVQPNSQTQTAQPVAADDTTPETSSTGASLAASGESETLAGNAAPEPAPQVVTQDQAPKAQPAQVEGSVDTAEIQPATAPTQTVIGTEKVADDVPAADATSDVATAQPDAVTQPTTDTQDAARLPSIGDESVETVSSDTPITAPVPQITSPVDNVVTNRLPNLATTVIQPDPQVSDTQTAAPVETSALRQFATTVEGVEDKALFSVLLIDSGADGVSRADLGKLEIPVTIAIDPSAPGAAQIMAEYRAAGVEVVAIANDLPVASSPSDVATAISAYFGILDQAVAIMDPLDGRIQNNRSLLQPVLGAIRDSGHGLITYDRGLNTAQQAARREDIPAATVFRILDAELEGAPKIKRYLDRAAFTANQDGAVVVVGRSYTDTVKAVVEWALEKKEAGIAMVPVSAVMLADQDG